jgi:hypothetical protein
MLVLVITRESKHTVDTMVHLHACLGALRAHWPASGPVKPAWIYYKTGYSKTSF